MVIAELAKSVSVTIQLVWLQVGFLYLVHKAMKKSAGAVMYSLTDGPICGMPELYTWFNGRCSLFGLKEPVDRRDVEHVAMRLRRRMP